MVSDQAADGQNPGQEAQASEKGDTGDGSSGGGKGRSVEDLEAQIEMLTDSVTEMRQALLSTRQVQAPANQIDIDDDEPLTASKVKKIVQSSVASAAAQTNSLNQRQSWDDKAKSEFPLADPKFLREFKREWREQTSSGLDPNHPKAIYNVAQMVAKATGVKKTQASARDTETTQTSEAPSNQQARQTQRGNSRSTISDDDPKVRFYAMKNGKDKAKMDAFKAKLGEKEAQRRSR